MRDLKFLAVAAFAAAVPAVAPAQQGYAELAAARRAGQVGERYDGYLGIASQPAPVVVRQVNAINIRRRSLYVDLGRRRGVTPQVAGLATGCELLTRVQVGEAYLLQDGVWRRRQPGQVIAQPSYCG
ncbi:YdbL family protein [Sphingomonas daechungensis]|uniref:YdbL family protein n=1 Tax=Sphingomonas daechungensis TaxID=1176646 RepID=A0ABX6T1S4_9SPHN|nr:YdbL family protein [Sphingomonas daechungensis]QNP42930.1 YdbL family protein [Sphingomonas daechungensis]